MRDALKHSDEILNRLSRDFVLMLDFDGTLSPIASTPQRAGMPPDMRRTLKACARTHPLAIVSGRPLADIQKKVGIPGILYIGGHGLESGRGTPRMSARMRKALADIRTGFTELSRVFTGIIIEDKGYALTLHYRLAPTHRHRILRRAGIALAADAVRRKLVRIIEGKCVVEILPALGIDKGKAARDALRQLSTRKRMVPVYVGDDTTDESAFRALARGVTVRVGQSSTSAAHFYLRSQAEVEGFLRLICRIEPR